MAAIKVSVACLFLRFKKTRHWRIFLFTMIGVQIGTALFTTSMHTTRFIPLHAMWGSQSERLASQVWTPRAFSIGITIFSSINILTDVIFSLLPVFLLWDIQRPPLEKLFVCFLMGLGLIASSASIVKIIKIRNFGSTNDLLAEGEKVAMWTILEEQLGLIAACMPYLKAQLQRLLTRFGFITSLELHSVSSEDCGFHRQQFGGHHRKNDKDSLFTADAQIGRASGDKDEPGGKSDVPFPGPGCDVTADATSNV